MISIITPSFNQIEWLRLAVASVADQEGVDYEHIIQDGGTDELTQVLQSEFPHLLHQKQLEVFVEKDAGMYDAVNRGLSRARGDICAYLNCDEQYLPGALSHVVSFFQRNPEMDVLLAGSVVVDGNGRYICSRPALKPSLRHLEAGQMYNLTCSIFFHARLVRERKLFFDPSLRIIGDLDWLRRVVETGGRIATSDFLTSAFSDLGTNLALSAGAAAEAARTRTSNSPWRKLSSAALVASHRASRLLAGHYSLRPFGTRSTRSEIIESGRSFTRPNRLACGVTVYESPAHPHSLHSQQRRHLRRQPMSRADLRRARSRALHAGGFAAGKRSADSSVGESQS
jgi:glycosyltransferase involved in cell wall biosynthesis